MYCLHLSPCSDLAWTTDNRLICQYHFRNGPPPKHLVLRSHLQQALLRVEHQDNVLTKQDRKDIITVLVKEDLLSDKGFQDIYSGEREQLRADPHPLRMSIDAIFPIWKAGGKFNCHHAENVGLTAEFLNKAKGDDIPVVLAIASEAVNARDMGDSEIKRLELAFDHAFRTLRLLPWTQLGRTKIAAKQSKAWWKQFLQMGPSGIYDGTRSMDAKFEFRVASGITKTPWDSATILRVNKICSGIERARDTTQKAYRFHVVQKKEGCQVHHSRSIPHTNSKTTTGNL